MAGTAGISFDEHGHITGVTGDIPVDDLPLATTTTAGAVIVPTENGNPLDIGADGKLTHTTTGNAAATGLVSINVDEYGHVSGGNTVLNASQVPGLDASKITSGQFPTERIGTDAVTAPKVGDYATCLMQEDNPGAGDFLGQFWYSPSTAQLRVYSRGSGPENIWLPVGFGALQANNLRWGGTYNAETDTLVSLTNIGVSEG